MVFNLDKGTSVVRDGPDPFTPGEFAVLMRSMRLFYDTEDDHYYMDLLMCTALVLHGYTDGVVEWYRIPNQFWA